MLALECSGLLAVQHTYIMGGYAIWRNTLERRAENQLYRATPRETSLSHGESS